MSAELAPPTATASAPLGPDSLAWRLGFDRTAVLLAGRALIMQVAHPAIGAAIQDFSTFHQDPWRRLDHTVASLVTQMFGGRRTIAEAARLRALHQEIKGTDFHGERYSALRPQLYAWVHMANLDTGLLSRRLFYQPFTSTQCQQFIDEWRQIGQVLGIPARLMPPDETSLRDYVDEMVQTQLEDNPTVHEVLDALALRAVPAPSPLLAPIWPAVRAVGGEALRDTTIGALPPALRAKFGLDFSTRQQRRMTLLVATARGLNATVPSRLLQYPMAYRAKKAAYWYGRTFG